MVGVAFGGDGLQGARRPGRRRRAPGRRARRRPDRRATASSRSTAASRLDGPSCHVPVHCRRSGPGREEWLVEFTLSPDGPREIAFRRACRRRRGKHGRRRRSAGWTCATRRTSRSRGRCSTRRCRGARARASASRAVPTRIATHGIVERTVSAVDGRLARRLRLGPRRLEVRRRRQAHQGAPRARLGDRADRRRRARALRLRQASFRVIGDVPGPELDEVAVGVVDVGRARVRAGRRTRARGRRGRLRAACATAPS